jgi:tripartite-type tricarboxylate transporter receptor subunit TctC
MRGRISFLAGIAVGIVAGTKIGRERYDQFKGYVQKVTDNPTVRKTAKAASHKASEITMTAAHATKESLPKVAEQAKSTVAKVRQRGHEDSDLVEKLPEHNRA